MCAPPAFSALVSLSRLVCSAIVFVGHESTALPAWVSCLIFVLCRARKGAILRAPPIERTSVKVLFLPARSGAATRALSLCDQTRAVFRRTPEGRAVFATVFCHHLDGHESTALQLKGVFYHPQSRLGPLTRLVRRGGRSEEAAVWGMRRVCTQGGIATPIPSEYSHVALTCVANSRIILS